jgi:hypothetical protein
MLLSRGALAEALAPVAENNASPPSMAQAATAAGSLPRVRVRAMCGEVDRI